MPRLISRINSTDVEELSSLFSVVLPLRLTAYPTDRTDVAILFNLDAFKATCATPPVEVDFAIVPPPLILPT